MLVAVVLYALLDRKLREYGAVLIAKNETAMCRALHDGVKGSGSMVEKYPEDFDLYRLGEMDNETGCITAEVPSLVDSLRDILRESHSG